VPISRFLHDMLVAIPLIRFNKGRPQLFAAGTTITIFQMARKCFLTVGNIFLRIGKHWRMIRNAFLTARDIFLAPGKRWRTIRNVFLTVRKPFLTIRKLGFF